MMRKYYFLGDAMAKNREKAPEPLKAIVIEDEPDLAELVSGFLEKLGFKVAQAAKYNEAVWKLQNQLFDLIIVDVLLDAAGRGDDIVAQIRSSTREPNCRTPVLIVSGHIDRALLTRMAEQPKLAMIVKPFKFEALRERIEQLVKLPSP